MTLPLQGIKVLDFTHLLPGELASSILADMGAELTRVERLEPGLVKHLPPIVKGESLYYWSLHRDERRIALDLKNERGLETAHRLVKDADVLLENFRPGVMSRLGLGYGKLHAVNPRLIYCSISSYGQNSAWSQRPGHDLNLQAETGLLHIGRDQDGRPVMPGVLASDFMSGLFAALATVAQIHHRAATGKGKHLDISMFDSTMYLQSLAATASRYLAKEPREADPHYRAELANYNVYRCKDGRYIATGALEIPFWKTMCEKLGRDDLAKTLAFGVKPELKLTLQSEFEKKTLAEWMEVFEGADCCVSPVNTIEEALKYLPMQERELFATMVHPVLGEVPQLRAPLPFDHKLEKVQANTDVVESTQRTLRQFGFSDREIEELKSAGVIPGKAAVSA